MMNEKLIAGYAAYTTADEFGVATAGAAPGTITFFVATAVATAGAAASAGGGTLLFHC